MKLLECNIAGFGAFNNYRLTFDDGLNVILQPNGWGKTTLAAYIKAMLYGFERKRVRNVAENERLRYRPWEGKAYGGTLDFELDGRAYRVLRTFGKTPAGDKLSVIDIEDGTTVELGGAEVGEWVFGLDANAFQKSVFVWQNGFGFDGSTTGLRNRLNQLVNEAEDTASLDDALAALDTRRKYYKKQGNHGYIADISDQMAALLEKQRRYELQIAEVAQLQQSMGGLDEGIADITAKATEARARLDEVQGGERELKALLEVGQQLMARKKELDEQVAAFSGAAGKVPSADELEQARRDIEALRAQDAEATRLGEQVRRVEDRLAQIADRHAGVVVTKDDVDAHRAEVAELAHQMEVLELAQPADAGRFAALDEAVAADAHLLDRADALVERWADVQRALAAAEEASRELESVNAEWKAQTKHVQELLDEHWAAAKAVPAGAKKRIGVLAGAERHLAEVARKVPDLLAKHSAVHEQNERMEAELGEDAAIGSISEDALERIAGRVEACEAAAQALAVAHEAAEGADGGADDLFAARDEAEAALRAAQDELGAARTERADAKNAQADARDAKARAEGELAAAGGPSGRGAAFACLVVGAIALVAGVVLGPATPVAFGAYALGAVALVAGIVLLNKGRAGAGPREEAAAAVKEADAALSAATAALSECEKTLARVQARVDEAERAREEAAAACESITDARRRAKEALKQATKEDLAAKKALIALLEPHFPRDAFDPATVAVKAPAYIERMRAAEDKLARLDESRSIETRLADELREQERAAVSACRDGRLEDEVGAAADVSPLYAELYPHALVAAQYVEAARGRAAELKGLIDASEAATARARRAGAQLLGKAAGAVAIDEIASACASPVAPNAHELADAVREARAGAEGFRADLAKVAACVGVEACDDAALEVERLSQTAAAYRAYRAEAEQVLAGNAETRARVGELVASLDAWARNVGLPDRAALTSEALDALAADAEAAEKAHWEQQGAVESWKASERMAEQKAGALRTFAAAYGAGSLPSDAAGLADAAATLLDELAGRASRRVELERERDLAGKQLKEWREQNGGRLAAAREQVAQGLGDELRERTALLQQQREGLLSTRSQYEERRSVLLAELEGYPAVAQEIKLLSQKKQQATARLNTVLATAQFLEQARASLDNRYLGGLTVRFNDYTESLLEDEGLSVAVGGDFDVAVAKDGEAHDVASYSSGYRDLLDLCFRMALVDTVFEGEPPFIVMDDPFANLDADKISRAMLLLALLAQSKQIIYFTCHASRIGGGEEAGEVTFTLPEQRASRELPRARAQREAEERARAQAELVASYHVVGATNGRASIVVAPDGRVISSNIVTLRFELDPAAGSRDNAFEVHFIDAKGRALCDRQTVEVIDGRVVPDRVRLSLASREDSGDTFDLIVHEQERDEAELVGRVPYRVELAFAADDFDF